jgi:hypothetical protein
MGLKDLKIEKREIVAPSGKFEVRGLTLNDIVMLLKLNPETTNALFSGATTIEQILVNSPEFCASIIAYAADEPGEAGMVSKLPLQVQLKALQDVWELTVLDEDEFVKMLRSLAAGAGRMAARMKLDEIAAGAVNEVMRPAKKVIKIGKGH